MREEYLQINNLKISKKILDFVNDELLVGTDISSENFWKGFDNVAHELAPKNRELLKKNSWRQKTTW